MSDREAMIEEQDQILGDLARLGLAFAEDLRARVALVTKVAEADALGLAFHRVTRSVRLALALRSKLARERHELARLDSRLAEDRAKTRRKQIRTVLINEIYADDDRSQEAADDLAERLDETLDEEALFDRFLEGPVEAGIAHIREELGLVANDAGPSPAEAPRRLCVAEVPTWGAEPPDPPPGRSPIEGQVDRDAVASRRGLQPRESAFAGGSP
jgi:hypothetical protein